MRQFALAFTAGITLASCSNAEPTVVGTWKFEGKEALIFAEDGAFTFLGDSAKISGAWKLDDDKIIVTVPGREEAEKVDVSVDPSTVAGGRKLIREEVKPWEGAVPTGDGEDKPVKYLYFQEDPDVWRCLYKLDAPDEKERLSLDCGFLVSGEFTR